MSNSVYVINAQGEREPFSWQKVYQSARRAGASQELAKKIALIVEKEIYSGIKTDEIFKKIRRLLKKEAPCFALRFSLKEGMRKLGPTGFPFEKYVGEIFSKKGFKVRFNQYIPGFCAGPYEIDFLAQKDSLVYLGECKYRRLAGERIHLDIALANYARFMDIKKGNYFKGRKVQVKSILATNTKFTSQVIRFSRCVGAELLGWRYPKKRGLEYLIEKEGLYPITILPSLSRFLASIFIERKMMLAKDLLRINPKRFVKETNIPENRLLSLIREAGVLLGEKV